MDQFTETYGRFIWIDWVNPSKEMLEQMAAELDVPPKVLLNCLDPDYLPHAESFDNTQFLILRLMEPEFKIAADTVQELTTKVAIFFTKDKLVSIHRMPLVEVGEVKIKLKKMKAEDVNEGVVLAYFFEQASLGFNNPLTNLEYKVEKFEERMFEGKKSNSLLREGYYIKRQSSAFRKVMKLTIDSQAKIIQRTESCPKNKMQEVKYRLERNLFYAEDVFDNVQSLLNLHMAIESQRTNEGSFRTNEIMRVLTVITIFFLPLNFLAGIFGMNFVHIPLLSHPLGFWISIIVMLVISVALSYYVMKKGWLEKPPKDQES